MDHIKKIQLVNFQKTTQTTESMIIPDSGIRYLKDLTFSFWQVLEGQLAQVDPKKEPNLYIALDARASIVYNAWLQFRYVDRRAV